MSLITFRTVLLLTLLSGLLVVVGDLAGGPTGAIIGLAMAFFMNFISYFFSDKLVLAMTGSKEVTAQEQPVLHGVVAALASRANMPMPKVYIMNTDSPNAFATGRDPKHAAVAATTGLLRIMSRDQLAGVIAHELGHVKNRDTLWMVMAATVAGAISYLAMMAQWSMFFGGFGGGDRDRREGAGGMVGLLATVILAPLAATMIQMAMSRQREYGADQAAARDFGRPLELASALETLDEAVHRRPMQVNPSMAHLFIVNPLSGGNILHLFSTHPPVAERVRRLREMAGVTL